MACAAKRKRAVLTLDAKHQILVQLEKGAKPSSLMQEWNRGKVIISDIKQNKEWILSYISVMEMSCGAKKCKTLKKESFKDVEKAMYLWFLQVRSRRTPISEPVLAMKVLQFFRWLHGDASPDVAKRVEQVFYQTDSVHITSFFC